MNHTWKIFSNCTVWQTKFNFTLLQFYNITFLLSEERLLAAQMLEEQDLPCKVYVDTMTDEACLKYGSIPERLYVIHEGKVAYAGGTGPFYYSVPELEYWLKCFKSKITYNPPKKGFFDVDKQSGKAIKYYK